MAKVMIFIDGSWLYGNFRNFGEDYQIDYGKLPIVISEKIAEQLTHGYVDLVRTCMFGSNATNYLDEDKEMVKRRKAFYELLREEHGYEVEVHLVDYRNRRLKKKDRSPDDDFVPQEKCVHIAMASSMIYFAALPNVFDIAVFIGGDKDYIPMLQKIRQLGKRIAIVGMHGACSNELVDPKDAKGVRDFDVIWMNEIMHDIQVVNEVRELFCHSPSHEGDNPVETDDFVKKGRNYICRACREKQKDEKPDYAGADNFESDEEQQWDENSPFQKGYVYTGSIKRLMQHCGFIETSMGDFYFDSDDCTPDTDFNNLQPGAAVDFIVTKQPNPKFRGKKGNGNAKEVALSNII